MTEFLQEYAGQIGAGRGGGAQAQGSEAAAGASVAGQGARYASQIAGVASGFLVLAEAAAGADAMQRRAGDELLLAEGELTQAAKDVASIRRAALEADASRRVAFAAAGVDLGSVSVQAQHDIDQRYVQEAIEARQNRGFDQARRRRVAARRLADRAAESFGAGVIAAGSQFASVALG